MRVWLSNRLTTGFRIADETPREATLAPAGFRELLRRECARSDRNGHQFALVDLTIAAASRKSITHLVDLVWERMRATDSAGWIDEPHRICALLFECPEPAAQRFGAHVADRMRGLDVTVTFTVYTYPGALPPALAMLAPARTRAQAPDGTAPGTDARTPRAT